MSRVACLQGCPRKSMLIPARLDSYKEAREECSHAFMNSKTFFGTSPAKESPLHALRSWGSRFLAQSKHEITAVPQVMAKTERHACQDPIFELGAVSKHWMHAFVYAYVYYLYTICVYTEIYVYIYIHRYTCTYMHACIHSCMHTYTHEQNTYMCAGIRLYIHMCMRADAYTMELEDKSGLS